jgi:hypothetical protein
MKIAHTYDEAKRNLYVLIPDADARELVAWKRRTWTEIHGMADGHSETARPGHPMHARLAEIVAYHERELPGQYVFVVGESVPSTDENGDDWRAARSRVSSMFVACMGITKSHDGGFYIGG